MLTISELVIKEGLQSSILGQIIPLMTAFFVGCLYNHWSEIWNGMENGMEQLQLNHVTGSAQCTSFISKYSIAHMLPYPSVVLLLAGLV